MIIELRDITTGGNNARCVVFINEVRAAELHCTPKELDTLISVLNSGLESHGFQNLTIRET